MDVCCCWLGAEKWGGSAPADGGKVALVDGCGVASGIGWEVLADCFKANWS